MDPLGTRHNMKAVKWEVMQLRGVKTVSGETLAHDNIYRYKTRTGTVLAAWALVQYSTVQCSTVQILQMLNLESIDVRMQSRIDGTIRVPDIQEDTSTGYPRGFGYQKDRKSDGLRGFM
jgi:hypothetical protein